MKWWHIPFKNSKMFQNAPIEHWAFLTPCDSDSVLKSIAILVLLDNTYSNCTIYYSKAKVW